MTAADFFDWASACARELGYLRKREAALRVPRSGGMSASRSGGMGDPTGTLALTVASEEPQLHRDIDRCERVVRRAEELVGEVGRACGQASALALQLHYLEHNGWEPISIELGMSLSTLYRMRRAAFSWIDREGVLAGVGKVDSRWQPLTPNDSR